MIVQHFQILLGLAPDAEAASSDCVACCAAIEQPPPEKVQQLDQIDHDCSKAAAPVDLP